MKQQIVSKVIQLLEFRVCLNRNNIILHRINEKVIVFVMRKVPHTYPES